MPQAVLFPLRIEGALDGEENMARDRDLLSAAEAGEPGCRIYSWNGPWISLGRFQAPERDLWPGSCVPWVMRPTGGKAVLHGHDVTVGLACPLDALATVARSLKEVYRALARPMIAALRDCGLPAALAEDTRFASSSLRTADCFAHISPNDIVDEATGQKVCGCALRLTKTAVLLQASIPAGRPLVDPQWVIRGGRPLAAPSWDAAEFPRALEAALDRR